MHLPRGRWWSEQGWKVASGRWDHRRRRLALRSTPACSSAGGGRLQLSVGDRIVADKVLLSGVCGWLCFMCWKNPGVYGSQKVRSPLSTDEYARVSLLYRGSRGLGIVIPPVGVAITHGAYCLVLKLLQLKKASWDARHNLGAWLVYLTVTRNNHSHYLQKTRTDTVYNQLASPPLPPAPCFRQHRHHPKLTAFLYSVRLIAEQFASE